jgi:hypothetical protein
MKKLWILLLFLAACKHDKKISTSFYYWKTVYRSNLVEDAYLKHFKASKLYLRITDVDKDETGRPVPVSPIIFEGKLPPSIQIIPVIFIVNNILVDLRSDQLAELAERVARFAKAKVNQGGRTDYNEMQIDCDWTAKTKNNYFYFLNCLKQLPELKNKLISVTLRLHQLKNARSCGIPPVKHVMLMCYNMGNLRKYGSQNSIIELNELKKYAGANLKDYPSKVDIGLPLFSWAVAFRDKQYIGISKSLSYDSLLNHQNFGRISNNLFLTKNDVPQVGLERGDIIRWESSSTDELAGICSYLSSRINNDTLNIIYFHLDQKLLKSYPYEQLQKINDIWR